MPSYSRTSARSIDTMVVKLVRDRWRARKHDYAGPKALAGAETIIAFLFVVRHVSATEVAGGSGGAPVIETREKTVA